MEKLTEFLKMGDYASFVWPAYGSAALILAAITLMAFRSLRQAKRQLTFMQTTDSTYEA